MKTNRPHQFLARSEQSISAKVTLGHEDRETPVRATYKFKTPSDDLVPTKDNIVFTSLQFESNSGLNLYANYLLQYGTVSDQLISAITEGRPLFPNESTPRCPNPIVF